MLNNFCHSEPDRARVIRQLPARANTRTCTAQNAVRCKCRVAQGDNNFIYHARSWHFYSQPAEGRTRTRIGLRKSISNRQQTTRSRFSKCKIRNPPPKARLDDPRPNIIFIMTDDQPPQTVAYMPTVKNVLMAEGVNFRERFPDHTPVLPQPCQHPDRRIRSQSRSLHQPLPDGQRSQIRRCFHGSGLAAGSRVSHRLLREIPEQLRLA